MSVTFCEKKKRRFKKKRRNDQLDWTVIRVACEVFKRNGTKGWRESVDGKFCVQWEGRRRYW